jgi:hypothetical protein
VCIGLTRCDINDVALITHYEVSFKVGKWAMQAVGLQVLVQSWLKRLGLMKGAAVLVEMRQ